MNQSNVHLTLRKISKRFNELHIPYVVCGGMALTQHGFNRFTEDVVLLVTREGLKLLHAELDGRGWIRPFEASKNLRDAETGVRIEFLLTGDYPGDGKPKPVSFPDPQDVGIEHEGIRFLDLPTLITLKLASGMTNVHRGKDLIDVEELISLNALPATFGARLHPFVQPKFFELWQKRQPSASRFLKLWNAGAAAEQYQTMDQLVAAYPTDANLAAMRAAGVTLDASIKREHQVVLVTANPKVAETYAMVDESQFFFESK